MKNKWIWILSAVLVLGIIVSVVRHFDSPKSLGVGDTLNEDGIRDDVALAIAQVVPDSERTRAAATQMARALQLAIDQPDRALEIHSLDEAASACLYAIRGTVRENEFTSLPLKIEAMVVNTYRRSRAYIRYNGKLSGRIFKSIQPDLSQCEFDTEAMRN